MRKVAVLFVMGLLTMSAGFASGNPDLYNEIEKKVIVDLSKIQLDDSNFVMVRFKIVNNGIEIQDISSSSKELKEIMLKELNDIRVDSDCVENKTYIYRFTFEKL